MEIANALKRLSPERQDPIPGMNVQIHEIFLQFSNSMFQKIKEQSSLDAELNALKEMIHAGWPAHIQQVPTLLKPYWPYRDELSTAEGHESTSYDRSRHAAERDFDKTTKEPTEPS